MDNIKDIINIVIGKIGDKKPSGDDKLERVWQSIIHGTDKKHTMIVGIKDGILSVHVDDPTRMYQLKLKRKKIVDGLREEIPEIKNVVFKIGKVK